MQHYSAPTRLLDFTHSFFIALYFALEELPPLPAESASHAPKEKRYPAVWAVNQTELDRRFRKKYRELDKHFKKGRNSWTYKSFKMVFLYSRKAFVRTINPYRLNERLIVQQGLFLCPGDLTKTFEANLRAIFDDLPNEMLCVRYELRFNVDQWKTALKQLEKMNVTASALFPGLDGFSRSLRTHMAFKNEIFPADPELYPRRTWD
jgi:hypothetical protein